VYIMVSDLLLVICVIRHSVKRPILYHNNVYIVVSARIVVICVIRHSVY